MSIFHRQTVLVVLISGLLTALFVSAQPTAAGERSAWPGSRTVVSHEPSLLRKNAKKNGFVSRVGVFRVRMVGYQLNRWSVHSPPDGICTGETVGGGFERVVFRSPARRMKLSAFGNRRLTSMILPRLHVRGQLTRKGTYDYTPLENPDPDCPSGDGNGDYVPTPPDCGTRKFARIPMSLFALDGFFRLHSEGSYRDRPNFRNCPRPWVEWPGIINEKTNGRPVQTRFPPRLFFNPRFNRRTGQWSKVIVIARGVKKQRTLTSSSVTRLEWTLTVKRLR